MGNKKLTISLVVYNGGKYLPLLFASLKKQTHQNFELIILDNNSTDNTKEIIHNIWKNNEGLINCSGATYKLYLIENKKNIGFASGHNEIFKNSNSEYFLVLNQDVYLESGCLDKLINFLDENKD